VVAAAPDRNLRRDTPVFTSASFVKSLLMLPPRWLEKLNNFFEEPKLYFYQRFKPALWPFRQAAHAIPGLGQNQERYGWRGDAGHPGGIRAQMLTASLRPARHDLNTAE
jgi:hypothetical protein